MAAERVNLLDFDREQLTRWCDSLGEKPFRAVQLTRWIHRNLESDFSKMTNLAKSFREKLEAMAEVRPPEPMREQISSDGTRKWAFDVGNGNAVEAVYIPEVDRGTLCISTQAGCAMGCLFCSTGKQGFARNLKTSEIVGQLFWAERELRREAGTNNPNERVITNVVLMGMGEPLQNVENVIKAMNIITDGEGIAVSRRRITLSTSGIAPRIVEVAEATGVRLAVSLHAPTDEIRSRIMPINKKYPLAEVMKACRDYQSRDGSRYVTFEYLMLNGINDSIENANQLINLMKKYQINAKFNLIAFNPWPGCGFEPSSNNRIHAFAKVLNHAGYAAPIRTPRGQDILAACGQLKSKKDQL